MSHPLRENLELFEDANQRWIRCARCLHLLCDASQDWKKVCKRRRQTPTAAGPLMADLVGQFQLEQLFCPGCGVLLNTDFVAMEED